MVTVLLSILYNIYVQNTLHIGCHIYIAIICIYTFVAIHINSVPEHPAWDVTQQQLGGCQAFNKSEMQCLALHTMNLSLL